MKINTRDLFILLPLITTMSFISGCSSGFPGARPKTYAAPGEARVFASTEKCPHALSGLESAIVVSAVAAITSQALSNFATVLEKGAEGGELQSSTSILNMNLDPGVIPRCIVIVRGDFESTSLNSRALSTNDIFNFSSPSAEQNQRINSLKLSPLYRVDHLIEISVILSSNKTALAFAPNFVRIDKSIDGSKSGERDLSVSLKFNNSSPTEKGSVVLIQNNKIGNTPTVYTQDIITGQYPIESPWFSSFNTHQDTSNVTSDSSAPHPEKRKGTVKSVSNEPDKTPGTVFSKSDLSLPVTLTSTVIETRPTNEGLAFIAAIFTSIKPKIEDSLKSYYDPTVQLNTKTNALENQTDYLSALQQAESSLIDYCSGMKQDNSAASKKDRLIKSSTARIDQLKANKAALEAGIYPPYKELVRLSSENTNGDSVCQ